ncbi:MAG: chloride channel protein [Methyloceanibacter sp.]|uniref:chloride channel protein n=1 Tax=Methyloceanibacter sp. TaxID=1965321 RepID=UPI001D6876A1|nr:chloride channel protein [Methyloceanibacter sp.]MCB1441595.1 chloride channel protein [Methyloceanibacter sp.]
MALKRAQLLDTARRWTIPNLKHFQETRQPIVWLLAPLIGLAAGVAAILFRLAIGAFQWPWLHTVTEHVAEAARLQPWWVIMLAPACGGLLVGLLLRYALTAKRTVAVPDVMEARVNAGRELDLRQGLISALTSALSLGCGGSAGREGPIVHLGACIATSLSRRLNLPNASRRTLLASGAAGAVAASFNAPIAGVLFAQEVILGHFSISTFVPLVLSSVVATILSQAWFGDVAAFIVPTYRIASYLEVPAFLLLGVIAALVAVLFQLTILIADWVARNINMPLVLRPMVGGLLIGIMAIWFPEILGVGYDTTDAAMKDQIAVSMMLLLIVLKTLATAVTLGSRFGGGVFSPALYLGAMTGGAFGLVAASIFPEIGSGEGLYAILGMGAVTAAVLGAPISTTVMVFELTGGFELSLALLLTVAVANGINQAILGRSFFQAQLESRGIVLHEGPHRTIMKDIRVSDIMRPLADDEPKELPEGDRERALTTDETLESALRAFDTLGAESLPVVAPHDRSQILGRAEQVRALRVFNRELIAASVEEHR